MEDSALIERIRQSPEDGLREAIAAYGGYAKAVALRILGRDRTRDIEEVLADVFCTVWRQLDSFDPQKGSLKGWVCTIARNQAVDRLRREQPVVELPETLDFTPDFADTVAAQTNRRIVRETVEGLPEPDRTIFLRRYFLRDPVCRIAERLGMDYKAVENRLYRGKQRLRRELEERGVIL